MQSHSGITKVGKFTKIHVVENVNVEICISNQSQLSELNKEEISQRIRHSVSVPDVVTKIKAEMLLEVLMRRTFITYLIQISNRQFYIRTKTHIEKGNCECYSSN